MLQTADKPKSTPFAGAWLPLELKRRLQAMSLLRGESESAVLRELIATGPLEPQRNAATDGKATPRRQAQAQR